jgi:hypothetical protein
MSNNYVPGMWRCPKCKFCLVQSNLNGVDGTVTARDDPGEKCPNCYSPLWRMTWKEHADELAARCEAEIITNQRLRSALDRIARFEETFEAAADKQKGNVAGSAMAATIAKYARKVLAGKE